MNANSQIQDRRTSGTQRSGRAAKVVSSVLQATGEELNRVGYANLRVDEVAERAGVNKTTIYRRWPTKSELVCEAVGVYFRRERERPDTGNLRDDLIGYLHSLIAASKTPMWRGILTVLTGRTDPSIEALAHELHLREREFRTSLVQRGIDRGELPRSVDAALIGDMFSAPILRRLLTFNEDVELSYAESVVDVALGGAAFIGLQKPAQP